MPLLREEMISIRRIATLFVVCSLLSACRAGPLPSNVTSSDIGMKSGSCALGDVVYLSGDEFPGSTPCDRCSCSDGSVRCNKVQCEPRPGCKALHRPDHCCPTYQCECEQKGRVYGNGEKLVDPEDPCRVCYCQGGEVVCRRIACFLRDDCKPRLVPGRCCPEYDNCPLRGVTSSPVSSSSSVEEVSISAASSAPPEKPKPEITIKEITPVSEIPILTDVKIKEILHPSPSIEIIEYPSSKNPLIPREATSEKPNSSDISSEVGTSIPDKTISQEDNRDVRSTTESSPSKIVLSTQVSGNEDKSFNLPSVSETVVTTPKPTIVEEYDPILFDHNPAFPPLPDDLSVQSNHEDEILPETTVDEQPTYHQVSTQQETTTTTTTTQAPVIIKEVYTTTTTAAPVAELSTEKKIEEKIETTTLNRIERESTTESALTKNSPMLNLRSAIPTELLNEPLAETDDINGQLDEEESKSVSTVEGKTPEDTPKMPAITELFEISPKTPEIKFTTEDPTSTTTTKKLPTQEDPTTSAIEKSNVATEVTSQTELSSVPIEVIAVTPTTENNLDKISSTVQPLPSPTSIKIIPTEAEPVTISRSSTKIDPFETVETTEATQTSVGTSAETATDAVELIKAILNTANKAPIIESKPKSNTNAMNDLIKLVGDVATINDHTEEPDSSKQETNIPNSEELLPVNGYKSKNNPNLNSITEPPSKKFHGNKENVVEIEEDEAGVTDLPAPHDRMEPTTKRPIIDNVSDDMAGNKTSEKDIEIIAKSYVPTINRRPTKVVMKKSGDKANDDASVDTATEDDVSNEVSTAATDRAEAEKSAPEATTLQ